MHDSSKFRIVVLTDTYFEINGVGSYYRTILDWCRRTQGGQVTVVCPTRKDLAPFTPSDDLVPIDPTIRLPNPVYRDLPLGWYAVSKLSRVLAAIPGPKVVHVATCGALAVAGAKAARKLGLPVVGYFHTDLRALLQIYGRKMFWKPGEWIGQRLAARFDRVAYARCEGILTPSPTACATVRRFFSGPTKVLPHPLNVDWFRPGESRTGRFRRQYGCDGKVLVAVIGRVAMEKGLDLVCELLCRDPRIQLVFVGDGPHGEALRARWGVTVTGFLTGQDLLDAYQQSDVLVQLSLVETFGLCLAEAMACGLPAIVLESRGLVETMPRDCGVEVLGKHELPQLADRCVALAGDAARHHEASRRAREFAMCCSPDVLVPQFIDFHRQYLR